MLNKNYYYYYQYLAIHLSHFQREENDAILTAKVIKKNSVDQMDKDTQEHKPQGSINVIHHINGMKDKYHMII